MDELARLRKENAALVAEAVGLRERLAEINGVITDRYALRRVECLLSAPLSSPSPSAKWEAALAAMRALPEWYPTLDGRGSICRWCDRRESEGHTDWCENAAFRAACKEKQDKG